MGSGSREPAPEGADQLYVEGEGASLEAAHRQASLDDALFRGQYVEVGCKPVLVTLPGEAMGLFEGGQRAARFSQLSSEHLLARDGIGGLSQCPNDLAVIQRDGFVILTASTAVLALERAAVEEGEAYRGANASKTRAAREQIAEPEGLQSDKRTQIDVGVEAGPRFLDALGGGFDAGTERGDIRPASYKVE